MIILLRLCQMFAVKGWNVQSSALKTQTDAVPNISTGKNPADGDKSKKRKRGDKAAPTSQVTDANVGDLWEQTIEGKKPKKDPKKAPKKRKTDDAATKDSEAKEVKITEHQPDQRDAFAAHKKSESQAVSSSSSAAAPAAPALAQPEAPKKKAKKGKKERIADKAKDPNNPTPSNNNNNNKNDNKTKKDTKKANNAVPSSPSAAATAVAKTTPPVPSLPPATKLTPLQAAMRQKLISARFRHLNETLYTAPSTTSLDLFSQNPEMFEDYHSGFRQQVTTWPANPVDSFIRMIRERGAIKGPKSQKQMFRDKKRNKSGGVEGDKATGKNQELPRTHGTAIFADLGCGDARLAQTLSESGDAKKLNLKVMSYDLQSPSPFVTKADVANLPLADGSVDVAIFCLALMGTNWIDFVEEAYRILHWKGELWVAEIKSRFGRVGGDGARTKSAPGRPVEHSVGSKKKLAAAKKKEEKDMAVKDERDENEALRTEVDEEPTAKGEETDISGFVEVLRRRGFLLKNGDDSVDLRNKMFVRLEFIKAAAPEVGKNFNEDDKKEDKRGGDTWKPKNKKFIDKEKKEKEVTVEDEAKVLKPCLYKIR